jgi:hypothetical protein
VRVSQEHGQLFQGDPSDRDIQPMAVVELSLDHPHTLLSEIMRKLGWLILLYHEDRLVGSIKGLDPLS